MARQSGAATDIQSLVDSFTSQLISLVRQSTLERIQAVLADGAGPAPMGRGGRRPGRPAGSKAAPAGIKLGRRAAGGGKRSPEELERMSAGLYDFIKKNPGQRGEQIAAALKTDVKTMRLPILKLIGEKKLKTKGQRRGMTYFAA